MTSRLIARPAGWSVGSILAGVLILPLAAPLLVAGAVLALAFAVMDHGPRPVRWIRRRVQAKTRKV